MSNAQSGPHRRLTRLLGDADAQGWPQGSPMETLLAQVDILPRASSLGRLYCDNASEALAQSMRHTAFLSAAREVCPEYPALPELLLVSRYEVCSRHAGGRVAATRRRLMAFYAANCHRWTLRQADEWFDAAREPTCRLDAVVEISVATAAGQVPLASSEDFLVAIELLARDGILSREVAEVGRLQLLHVHRRLVERAALDRLRSRPAAATAAAPPPKGGVTRNARRSTRVTRQRGQPRPSTHAYNLRPRNRGGQATGNGM